MIRSIVYSLALPSGTLSRDLKLIFVSNLIGAVGDGLYAYILPVYIRDLGASSADVGFLFSIFILSTALTIIPGGILADRYDRKKVMVLGWLLWVPVPLLFSAATHWTQLVPVMALYGFFSQWTCNKRICCDFRQKGQSDTHIYVDERVLVDWLHLLSWIRRIFIDGCGNANRAGDVFCSLCRCHDSPDVHSQSKCR